MSGAHRQALAKYDAACRAVAAARTVDVAKGLRDEAEAMRVLARAANNRQLEIDCAEIRVRAERRLGELLIAAKHAGQVRKGRVAGERSADADRVDAGRVTLAAVGIDRKLSMTAQRLAAIEAAAFEAMVAQMRDDLAARGGRALLDIAGRIAKEERDAARRADYAARVALGCSRAELEAIAAAGARFGAIYADPNWDYRTWSDKGSGRSASQHYATAADDDILAYGPLIASLAAADCALFLWATGPQLPLALALIAAAGFTYKTIAFAWAKLNKSVDPARPFAVDDFFIGNGHWTRANAEVCLLATIGAPTRLNADVRQTVIAPVGAHSQKPPLHDRIARLVAGPYLEMFARSPVDGWTVWGDEIPRQHFFEAARQAA